MALNPKVLNVSRRVEYLPAILGRRPIQFRRVSLLGIVF
jgi:hypothetical protein